MKNVLLAGLLAITANAMTEKELEKQLVCVESTYDGSTVVSRIVPTVTHLYDYLYKAYRGKHHKFEITNTGSFNHSFEQYGKEEIKVFYKKTKAKDGRTCHIINKLRIDGKTYTDKGSISIMAVDWAIPTLQ